MQGETNTGEKLANPAAANYHFNHCSEGLFALCTSVIVSVDVYAIRTVPCRLSQCHSAMLTGRCCLRQRQDISRKYSYKIQNGQHQCREYDIYIHEAHEHNVIDE